MQFSQKLERVLNDQINKELTAFYTYLGLAAWFETTPYSGFASWMKKQSKEELEHMERIFNYINNRGGKVTLKSISQPKCTLKTPLEAFELSLEHEESVTASIRGIYELAIKEKDYETQNFLNWFLEEQIEEEKSVGDMIALLKLANGNINALLKLDSMAMQRK